MKFEDKVKVLREKKFQGRETDEFLRAVITMAKGEELEYLLGDVVFCGARVDLTYRPMIPRPETEFWVNSAIKEIQAALIGGGQEKGRKNARTFRVLDLFAGSGCVGLAVLKNIKDSHVTFVEIDAKSHDSITLSLEKNHLPFTSSTIHIQDCTLFLENNDPKETYDAIFAVPPYVPLQMQEEVMEELHNEEPLFFFDKEDGYYYHVQILMHAKKFLRDDGILYLEFDITQREQIIQLIDAYHYRIISFCKDPYGHDCAVSLR